MITRPSNVFLIAAVGRNGQIGLDGHLPWRDSEDLKYFRSTTMGGVVLVGWRTARSLPPLPGRIVVVDSRETSPDKYIAEINTLHGDRDIFVAGGAKTYTRYRHLVRRSFITHIDHDGRADAFMPALW